MSSLKDIAMQDHQIIISDWQTHQAELTSIRTNVFINEQQVSLAEELDGRDELAIHFLAQTNTGETIGCARLLVEIHNQRQVFHIGRVAILKAYRQQGIGHSLMRFILDYCGNRAAESRIYLHAQIARKSFYEVLGFIAEGEEFMDAGIPHISMFLGNNLSN
jgi:predicted GNAT family N-acyltransferase